MARTPEPDRLFLFPMAKDPAFLFYPSDFLTGVSDLTMEERGIYITLLCLQHQKGRLTEKMMRLCHGIIPADVLHKFSIDENGLYYNKRLEEEIEKRKQHSEKQRLRALDGWKKRKNNDATADATALPLEDINENEINNNNGVKKNPVPKLNHAIIEIAQRTYYNVKRKKIEPFQVQEIYQTFIDLNYKDGTDKPPDEVHRHFANWIKFQNIEVEELNDFQKQAALIRLQQQQNGVTNIA